ncbi:DUF4136 domain-containing protein [Pedobacter sp. MW01-1-1]|uniref:DUF4136 domain-containing protein n=1 Tax=Pedobacter sp. MW01-1-1 TaxID=3383027 RepID=UPI003FEF1457
MKNLTKILMLIAVVIALASCSTLRTASDFDNKVDFGKYKSFAFYDKGIARLHMNDLDKRRMLAAVESQMIEKGFTKTDTASADLLINMVMVARERTEVYNNFYGPGWGWGWGWGWRNPYWGWGGYGWGGPSYVDQYMEGTFIIDFLDPKQKKLVWHGRGVGFNLDNLNKREERINEGAKEILAQYPPLAAK